MLDNSVAPDNGSVKKPARAAQRGGAGNRSKNGRPVRQKTQAW
jgi:hypothetical protein